MPEPIDRYEFAQSLRHPNAAPFYGPSASILLIADGVDDSQFAKSRAPISPTAPGAHGARCRRAALRSIPNSAASSSRPDLAFPQSLRVNYSFGFAGRDRRRSLRSLSFASPGRTRPGQLLRDRRFTRGPTLESAIAQWNQLIALTPASTGVIVLPNFECFSIDLTGEAAIQLPAGRNLSLHRGQPITSAGALNVIWNHSCVTLTGNIEVIGTAGTALPDGEVEPAGQLLISGLWIAGQLSITGETRQHSDRRLDPGSRRRPHPQWRAYLPRRPQYSGHRRGSHTHRDPLHHRAHRRRPRRHARASARASWTRHRPAASPTPLLISPPPARDLHVEDSTMIGKVHTRTIPLASNTIFYARRPRRDPWPAAVWASRRQTGCVRFCCSAFRLDHPAAVSVSSARRGQ